MTDRLFVVLFYFLSADSFVNAQARATLVVTGSVHGQLDPCG